MFGRKLTKVRLARIEKRLDEIESRARSDTQLYYDDMDGVYHSHMSYHQSRISVARVCRMILNHLGLGINKTPAKAETTCLMGKGE